MEFRRLKTDSSELFTKAMMLYEESFPIHEQRKAASQSRIMSHEEYCFYLIYEAESWVGIMLCWETADFIYVEHFCIFPEMRSKKYGQAALVLLNEKGKKVILEIDPPVDEISIHRKAFYQRGGYQPNSFAHVHPPYREGFKGHQLVIMSCPEALTPKEYQDFDQYLKETVMGMEEGIFYPLKKQQNGMTDI